jgi:hypothetical protein
VTWFLLILAAATGLAVARLPADGPSPPDGSSFVSGRSQPRGKRSGAALDPQAPVQDLLPEAPQVTFPAGPAVGDDLAQIPEVELQAAPPTRLEADKTARKLALQLDRIDILNEREEDGFVKALRGQRPDLAGLPFALGAACRGTDKRSKQFADKAEMVRWALTSAEGRSIRGGGVSAKLFWWAYGGPSDAQLMPGVQMSQEEQRDSESARVAALMQVLAPEPPALRMGLVRYLAELRSPEACRALAQLAIFSPEQEVRDAAVDALQARSDRASADVLLSGLCYPWPAAAERAAQALVRLKRTDLLRRVVEALEARDPRAPALKEVDGKKALVVRELVKVNHHRNCLLCHAPAAADAKSGDPFLAVMPIPNAPFPSQGDLYYGVGRSTPAVRFDVTYLRQDFSVYQTVADAAPWPEKQRFDFLVRERVLTEEEAAAFRAKLDDGKPGEPSPYRKAALSALRGLTGADAGTTAAAWRDLLSRRKE